MRAFPFCQAQQHPMEPSDRRTPLTWRMLLQILAAVAVIELGFFLFRMGAAWWNHPNP
ncbi:MAG: hypothetical protein LUO80_10850 [Methylococcaceae bacterium]|nr:hypothetical protein [Methylococcaceae bacterium]